MTLNITVLTPTVIYQSADFRVTDSDTHRPRTDQSAKTVSLHYQDWLGFVTYTGLGQWDDRDVSDYVAEWLAGQSALGFDDVAAYLAAKGTELIDKVHVSTGRPRMRHTFVLAGFVSVRASVAVISNFQAVQGKPRPRADAALSVSCTGLRGARKAVVLLTGSSGAVTLADRRLLQRIARGDPENGTRMRQRLAAVNKRASGASSAISPGCTVMSLRADGRGALQMDAEGDRPSFVPQLMNGMEVHKSMVEALANVGIDLSAANLVQAAFARFSPTGPASVGPETGCAFSVATPGPERYTVREITSSTFEIEAARALSDEGHVAGNGWLIAGLRLGWRPGEHAHADPKHCRRAPHFQRHEHRRHLEPRRLLLPDRVRL